MMKWNKRAFFKSQIKAETNNAILISCPHNSDYDGYCFWVPASLVKESEQKNILTFSYSDDFEFALKKYGNGKFNKYKVIDTITLRGDEIEDVYVNMIYGTEKSRDNPFETHIPDLIEAVEKEIHPELIDE